MPRVAGRSRCERVGLTFDILQRHQTLNMEQKIQISEELHLHVMRCIEDHNGNHVLQKCITKGVPLENLQFILDALRGQVIRLDLSFSSLTKVTIRQQEYPATASDAE